MSELARVPEEQPEGRPQYVDWEFAKATGRRLVSAGPRVTPSEAAAIVGELHEAAAAAREPIASTSRLHSPADAPPVLVVDRPGWMDLNIESMASLVAPVIEKVTAGVSRTQPNAVTAIGGKVTGAETGAVMSFLASKVLGQYDLAPQGVPRLMLVAPNIVQTERELKVDTRDFRLWVAMHEETHRLQFTANPWLRDHMVEQARSLAVDLAPDPERLHEIAGRLAEKLPDLFREGSTGVADLFTTPEQRDKLAGLTAVMSLLEGHADVVMDDVGPAHIPTVAHIRARFSERRKGGGTPDRLLRRLLGLEAKMRQYRDGAVFVRGVQERVGVEGFNAIWTSPDTLPLAREIEEPESWVRRIHG